MSAALSPKTGKKTMEWIKNNHELINVGVTRAKEKFVFVGDKEAIDVLSGGENNDIKVLSDYVYKNGEIVVPKSDVIISYDFSNDSKNEKDFFDTVKPYFNRRGSKFRIERNVSVKNAIKNVLPEDLEAIGKKEFDVIVQASMGFMNRQYRTIVAFEIDGGEHIGSKKTAELDRQKEEICKKYGIKPIRIANSAVKDYESIISVFEFVVKDLKDIEEAYNQMNIFEDK
jgi:very-short-patch-repair endonuclease